MVLHSTPIKVLLFYLAILESGFVKTTFTTSNEFETLQGKKIKQEFTYFEGESLSVLHCATYCAKNVSCKSASYSEMDGSCRLSLYRVCVDSNIDKMIDESPWILVSKKVSVNLEEWTNIGDSHYMFTDIQRNYETSKIFCEEKGGKLAEPRTNASFELLRSYMVDHFTFTHYWFGVNDIEGEGHYVWTSDGVNTSYTAWHPTQPNDGNRGNCLFLYMAYGYLWADGSCFDEWLAICEH